jgi:drug/metabolite transporter (DMT)-like permease
MSRRHLALLVIGVLAVSSSSVLVRVADAPAFAIAFYRSAMAAAVLMPLALVRYRDDLRAIARDGRWRLSMLAGVFLALHFATWIPSVSLTTVAASVVLVTSSPLWVAVLGRFIGERPSRRTIAGIVVALLGTLVISGGDLGGTGRALGGDILALLGAVFAAAYVLTGRYLRKGTRLVPYTALVYSTAAAVLAVAMLATGTAFTGYPSQTWLVFLAITVGPQFLGHTTFNYLLGHVRAQVVAVAVMAEPVGATILAFAVLGEIPEAATLAGGALILAGVYLAVAASSRADVATAAME